MDHNQSFQPNWLQMTCFVWKPCSDQHWQDKFWFICLVNNHLLYYWPNSHYSILKICPKFQVLSFQFSGVNELLDEHWAKIENISTAIYKMYQWKFLHSRILIYSVWPWYCTWAILQAKIQFKVARYNLSAVFFSVWIPTCASVVKESCSKLGNMGSILAGCWHSLTTWAHMF